MSFLSQITKLIFSILCGMLIVILGLFLFPQLKDRESRMSELHALENKLEQSHARLAELRSNQNRFENDRAFVEKTCYEIGMVWPDEIIFRFHDDDTSYE